MISRDSQATYCCEANGLWKDEMSKSEVFSQQRMDRCMAIQQTILLDWQKNYTFRAVVRAMEPIHGLSLNDLRKQYFAVGIEDSLMEIPFHDMLVVFQMIEQVTKKLKKKKRKRGETEFTIKFQISTNFPDEEVMRLLSGIEIQTPFDEGKRMRIVEQRTNKQSEDSGQSQAHSTTATNDLSITFPVYLVALDQPEEPSLLGTASTTFFKRQARFDGKDFTGLPIFQTQGEVKALFAELAKTNYQRPLKTIEADAAGLLRILKGMAASHPDLYVTVGIPLTPAEYLKNARPVGEMVTRLTTYRSGQKLHLKIAFPLFMLGTDVMCEKSNAVPYTFPSQFDSSDIVWPMFETESASHRFGATAMHQSNTALEGAEFVNATNLLNYMQKFRPARAVTSVWIGRDDGQNGLAWGNKVRLVDFFYQLELQAAEESKFGAN